MELLIDHVTKQFKDKKAVDNITLKLTPGVWGLLGANGAGKTTLMRMITGIMPPSSGDVLYDGVSIRALGERYRDIFGYLPQEFGFYQELTVKDYLEYVAALKGLPERKSRRRIGELLEQVSLLDAYHRKISKLSGGMKRRVGIAQALLNDPKVLILDEPTGGLDPGARVRFRNLIRPQPHCPDLHPHRPRRGVYRLLPRHDQGRKAAGGGDHRAAGPAGGGKGVELHRFAGAGAGI